MNTKLSVMSKSLITRNGVEKCRCGFCQNRLALDEQFISKKGKHAKWYHLDCAKKINVI